MPWYRTGTVAITAGHNTVTGTGTAFSANVRVGDAFLGPDGRWYEITNVASATVLSILPAYMGSTVTGASYSITPVQGYPKALADSFREVNNLWGSTLAGLGAVSTENVVPVAKGGTGGTTPASARSGLGLKLAALADILGVVSQSGGVPTGAIYEHVSNANGECVRFASGMQICWGSVTTFTQPTLPYGSTNLFRTAVTWTYPVPFVGSAHAFGIGDDQSSNGWFAGRGTGATSTSKLYISATGNVTSFAASMIAIGRWF